MTSKNDVQPLPAAPAYFARSLCNYDMDRVSLDTGLACADPSLAVQSQAEEADINVIVKRFGISGQLPQSVRLPEYGDFEGPSDYHAAMNYVTEAQGAFLSLPAAIRAEFNNDPGEFLAYVEQPENREAVFNTFGVSIDGFEPSVPSPSLPSSSSPPATEKGVD